MAPRSELILNFFSMHNRFQYVIITVSMNQTGCSESTVKVVIVNSEILIMFVNIFRLHYARHLKLVRGLCKTPKPVTLQYLSSKPSHIFSLDIFCLLAFNFINGQSLH